MTSNKYMLTSHNKGASQSDENVLSIYLKEINRIPLLTRAEEDKYARLARTGDIPAKEMLIKSNLRFVVNVAKKYQNQGIPLSDLISEGNIGLMTAIDRYDVDKGFHFISYAVWWIRQAILKAICEKSRLIRLPLNRANELVQIEKARKLVQNGNGEEAELKEIGRLLDMNPKHVSELLQISREIVSLESPIYSERDSSNLGDFIEDTSHMTPENYVVDQDLKDNVDLVLQTLTAKEAEIIRYRFGLSGKRQMSLKEIGDQFHLTKERIRQIEKKAIKRLQHPSRSGMLESFVA